MMPGITDPPGNPREPRFERDAQRIGKKDRHVELRAQPLRHGENAFVGLARHDLVDLRDAFPYVGQLRRREDGEVRIDAPALDRPHRRDAHHRIAQPVAAADQDAERLQSCAVMSAGSATPRL